MSFIYVHGANGSGKTTLARVLIACAGGISKIEPLTAGEAKGATVTFTNNGKHGLVLIGPYRSATGGADSVQPYALVPAAIKQLMLGGYQVFAEGLMTPGVETCRRIWVESIRLRVPAHFVLLDVPVDECTQHVQARRDRKGNRKPYDNSHLIKKHRNANNWIVNLRAAGLRAHKLTWKEAVAFCLAEYRLSAEKVKWEE